MKEYLISQPEGTCLYYLRRKYSAFEQKPGMSEFAEGGKSYRTIDSLEKRIIYSSARGDHFIADSRTLSESDIVRLDALIRRVDRKASQPF